MSPITQRILDIIANDPYNGDERIGRYGGDGVLIERFYRKSCPEHIDPHRCMEDSDGNWGGPKKHRGIYYWQEWLWSVECNHCGFLSPTMANGISMGEYEPLALVCPVCGYVWQLYDVVHPVVATP